MKSSLRAEVLERRRRLPADKQALDDVSLARNTHTLLTRTAAEKGGRLVVAAHVPVGTEPGATVDFVGQLAEVADEILLPVCPPGPPAPLRWGVYTGELRKGRYGLDEPIGETLPPESLSRADVVLLPAVAADGTGMRLGRGAGYYDRSLIHANGLLAVILHDGEVFGSVPFDDHDRPVDVIVTPSGIQGTDRPFVASN